MKGLGSPAQVIQRSAKMALHLNGALALLHCWTDCRHLAGV